MFCPQTQTPYPGNGVNRSKVNFFQKMVMLHIKFKGITKCSNMVANILPTDLYDPRGWGKNSTFSEHGHVAYQIKWKHKYSNMVANILPPRGWGQNSTFSKQGHVAYQLKGMEHRPPCKHIFSPHSHPQPVGRIKRLNKIKNLNAIILHIKLSGKLILKERCID